MKYTVDDDSFLKDKTSCIPYPRGSTGPKSTAQARGARRSRSAGERTRSVSTEDGNALSFETKIDGSDVLSDDLSATQ